MEKYCVPLCGLVLLGFFLPETIDSPKFISCQPSGFPFCHYITNDHGFPMVFPYLDQWPLGCKGNFTAVNVGKIDVYRKTAYFMGKSMVSYIDFHKQNQVIENSGCSGPGTGEWSSERRTAKLKGAGR